MIVDFFRRGTGASSGPIDYLLGKNRDREHATVLQGDVNEIAGLIDSSPYIKKYTAGCLSFYEHDLRPEQKQQIMDDFEKCLFPGMAKDQYRVLWVEHKDKLNTETGQTRLELNFLIPNVEISSGKRLQPFYAAADLDRVECFKQITNHQYALYDPDDPANRQATKVAKALPTNAKELKAAIEIEIEAALAIGDGIISDRQSLVKWLGDIGLEVTRQTPNSISIKHPDDAKARPIRLTGAMYEQDFRYTDESPSITAAASERYRAAATERYTASCERYDKMLAAKSAYHQQRYRPQSERDTIAPDRSNSSDIAADRPEHSQNQATATAGHDRAIAATANTDQTATSELAAVERLEPRNVPSSEIKENPYYIEYSLDFNSLYHAYQQYLFSIRQQKQVQRTTSEISTFAANRSHDTTENSRVQHGDNSTVQGTRGEINNDTGSAIIADYRAATAAAQRATETARASLAAYTAAGADYQRARELHSDFKRETQRSSASRETLSNDSEAAIRADNTTAFFRQFAERLTATAGETFNSVSRLLEHRAADQQSIATIDTDRDREAARTTGKTSDRENEFSRAISAKTSRFSATPIHEALERVEQRQQKQAEKKQDYASPRPF